MLTFFDSPRLGTVADRIRAFQGGLDSDNGPPPASNVISHNTTKSTETSLTSDAGLPKDANIGRPLERQASVAHKHVQGHTRPSLSSPRKQNQLKADKSGQSPRKASSRPRPSAEVERSPVEPKTTEHPEQSPTRRTSRRRQSMDNMAVESSEFAGARSRLRSVIDGFEEKPNSQRSRAYTLAELNHMLDDAIGGGGEFDEVLSGSMTGEATPMANIHQDHATVSASQHQSRSQERFTQSSLDTVRPRSSNSSEQDVYDDEKNALYWPHLITRGVTKRPHTSHSSRRPSTGRVLNRPGFEPAEAKPVQARSQFSPVRQRAAMFESLGPMTLVHSEDCGPSQRPPTDYMRPKQQPAPTTTKVHKIKFGNVVDERPRTPLIPLTLPQMLSPREGPNPPAQRTNQTEVESAERGSNSGTVKEDRQRKSSMSWPFRWGIFNKTASAQHDTEDDVPTDVQPTPRLQPRAEPNVVKSRVQDLLLAANERDDEEKKRWNQQKERMSRRHSRFPTLAVVDSSGGNEHVEPRKPLPTQAPPQSMPLEKPVEAPPNFLSAEGEAVEPNTPLQRAMTEKQVLSPMSLPRSMTESETSPKKSAPQTPIRGRSRKSTHRLSVNDQERSMGEQLHLSSRSSRSVSRTGGRGGVKVEVEVRDSPEREARERGEKIVIIRANVEDLIREQ